MSVIFVIYSTVSRWNTNRCPSVFQISQWYITKPKRISGSSLLPRFIVSLCSIFLLHISLRCLWTSLRSTNLENIKPSSMYHERKFWMEFLCPKRRRILFALCGFRILLKKICFLHSLVILHATDAVKTRSSIPNLYRRKKITSDRVLEFRMKLDMN